MHHGRRRTAAAAGVAFAGAGVAWARIPDSAPPLPRAYDRAALAAHFSARPGAVARRWAEVGGTLAPWALRAAKDRYTGANEQWISSAELRSRLTKLGPAFIKLGQMLATRRDQRGEA